MYSTCFIFSCAILLARSVTVPLPGHHTCLHLLRLRDVDVLNVAILCESVLALFVLQKTIFDYLQCTESVNFLGLEVFLAPPTAWAGRNQPQTPKN